MKVKGSELALFMKEGWPEDKSNPNAWFWDHEEFDSDPVPETTYNTDDLGNLYWHGKGNDPSNGNGLGLARLIKNWRLSQTHTRLVFDVPKKHVDKAILHITSQLKGKQVK